MERRTENWPDAQRGLALRAALVLALASWWGWYLQLNGPAVDMRLLALMLAGGALALVAGLARPLPAHLAVAAQVLVTFFGVTIAYVWLGYNRAASFLLLPVVLAAFLLPLWSTVLVVLAAVAVLPFGQGVSPGDLAQQRLLLVVVGLLVGGCSAALRVALGHAWRSAEAGATLAREVRLRQGEVNRLNRQLQLANYLLKRGNYELALARQEAEEARHAKERFASSVSHELRTPLNIILGFAEMMQRFPEVYGEAHLTPLLRQDIAEVQRSARYLSDLVDDILDLARLDARQMPVHREWMDLGRLLADAAGVAGRLVVGKPVEVSMELQGELPRLFLDRVRIRQVLLNLLTNASRLTHEGSITLGARAADDGVIVFVRDTGPGIPPDRLEDIFEEFHQVEGGALSSERQGKGLGLAIAKRFVQLHGGRIWAESEVGRGSHFYFWLPLGPKQVATSSLPDMGTLPCLPEKPGLVVVDRDASAAAYLSRRLERFQVRPAADLGAAKALVHAEHPLAVLVNLPPSRQADAYAAEAGELEALVPVIRCALPFGSWLLEDQLFESWLVKPVSAAQLEAALGGPGRWRKVLIVDDDRAFAQLLLRLLRAVNGGCQASWAHSAQEALARLGEEAWDVLLVDIALPDMDGRALARLARQATAGRQPRMVAVSGLQPGEEREQTNSTSFSLSKHAGLREAELLGLIEHALQTVSLSYLPPVPASAPPAAGGALRA